MQETLFRLVDTDRIGVALTDGHMMEPEASVSGRLSVWLKKRSGVIVGDGGVVVGEGAAGTIPGSGVGQDGRPRPRGLSQRVLRRDAWHDR